MIPKAHDAKNGSDQGKRAIQLNKPLAPCILPAISSEAMIVNAVTKLGYMTEKVRIVWVSFHPALIPGSANWWWNPTGTESNTNIMKTTRPSVSLNSFPPATFGNTVYQSTYAGSSQK